MAEIFLNPPPNPGPSPQFFYDFLERLHSVEDLMADPTCIHSPSLFFCVKVLHQRHVVAKGKTHSVSSSTYINKWRWLFLPPWIQNGEKQLARLSRKGSEEGVTECNVWEICLFFRSIVFPHGHRVPRKFYSLLGDPLGIIGSFVPKLKHTSEKPGPSIPPLMGVGSSWEP